MHALLAMLWRLGGSVTHGHQKGSNSRTPGSIGKGGQATAAQAGPSPVPTLLLSGLMRWLQRVELLSRAPASVAATERDSH